jgi:hypothetical protein
MLKDGSTFNMKVPSGPQPGVKVFISPPVEVATGLSAELLLDFDLSKSFVVKGNPNTPAGINGFNFKPVIRGINKSVAGRILGTVSDTSDVQLQAAVWAEQDTGVVATTFSDASGAYAFIGIPAGTYSLHAAQAAYDTVRVENVSVVAGNQVQQDFVLTPVAP